MTSPGSPAREGATTTRERARDTARERAWSWTVRAKRSLSFRSSNFNSTTNTNTRFGTRLDDIEQPSTGSYDFDDDSFTSLPTETNTEYGSHALGPIRLPTSTNRSLRLRSQLSLVLQGFVRITGYILQHIVGFLRRRMFLVICFLLLGGYVHYLWRAEATINVPWVPDPASRLFAQTPLAPLPVDADITTYQLPLRTKGRNVVDRTGRRFKLLSVNWYGASDELFVPGGLDVRHRRDIAATIRALGFNSVRMPYADEIVVANPVIDSRLLAANPDLQARQGIRALDVLEAVTNALTDAGLAVILNNHITHATWCCGADPCDAAWSNDHLGPLCRVRQSEEDWIRNWETVMLRFVGNPLVIGADLRNEVRGLWGTMPWSTWAAAAERAGNRLLKMNPNWLIIVGGTESGNDLRGVASRPVVLSVPDRVVYSAHVYAWSGWGSLEGRFSKRGYASFVHTMRENWAYLVEGDRAPVWVGEFGAPAKPSMGDANYWQNLLRYLKVIDADFGYWAINPRKPKNNTKETYALVEDDWVTPVLDYRMKDMSEIMNAGEPETE